MSRLFGLLSSPGESTFLPQLAAMRTWARSITPSLPSRKPCHAHRLQSTWKPRCIPFAVDTNHTTTRLSHALLPTKSNLLPLPEILPWLSRSCASRGLQGIVTSMGENLTPSVSSEAEHTYNQNYRSPRRPGMALITQRRRQDKGPKPYFSKLGVEAPFCHVWNPSPC